MSRMTTRGEGKIVSVPFPEELHRKLKVEAAREGITLKELLVKAAEVFLRLREQEEVLTCGASIPMREYSDKEIQECDGADKLTPEQEAVFQKLIGGESNMNEGFS
jgi:hypothetical protein